MSLADMASKAGLSLNISSLGLLSKLKDMTTADVTADVLAEVCAAFKLTPNPVVISEVADLIRNQPSTALPEYLSREDVFLPLMDKLMSKPSSVSVPDVGPDSEEVPVICTVCDTHGKVSRRDALLAGKFVSYKCPVCNARRDILSRSIINFGAPAP